MMRRHLNSTGCIEISSTPKSQQQPSDDTNVGDIEDRPPAQINEINDRVLANDVEQISGGAAECQSQPDLRNSSMEPDAGTMQGNGRREGQEPNEDESSPGAGAAIDPVEIGNATNVDERHTSDESAWGKQLHGPLAPLIEQQEGGAGGK